MSRQLTVAQALREATDLCMAKDDAVYILGLGVTDPKGTFGTTAGLEAKYGSRRVLDMPTAENGMTGIAIGSALVGQRPVMTHQRMDFALLAMEQIVNQAANWSYMFGGRVSVPLVIRMIVGRGWGQGPQHSQNFQTWFAHVPGLKVVVPTTAYDAKGLLISAIEDDNPVIFIEHRWLHSALGDVPEGLYRIPIGKARIIREGSDVTIVAASYMTAEALRAATWLERNGVEAEVIDLRSLRPLDGDTILQSVSRTGRLIVAETGWRTFGFGGEIVSSVVERGFDRLVAPPKRIALPDHPTPTSPALSTGYYPRAVDVVNAVAELGLIPIPSISALSLELGDESVPHDVPDPLFRGPF